MLSKRAAGLNAPALIPVAGHCDRKPRPLDRDVNTIGRARGTDFCLEANEISTLHCIIYRTAEGYRIRDCNSRCGTRINGESVKSGILHDADIINLGPFSFEFRAPANLFPQDGVRLDPLKVEHWKTSRRRLAERALALRKRLNSGSPREQEWVQKGHLLKEKIRCYDQRLGELEAAEDELNQERSQLAQEAERHRQHVQTIEKQLADRLTQTDKEIHDRWQEFQKRCKAEEARAAAVPAPAERKETLHDSPAQRQQAAVEMNQHLRELEAQYNRRHDQLQRVQQEFTTMKEQWVNDQTKLSASLEDQQAALAQKKAELLRMMGDLKKMQEDLRRQAKPDVRALNDEVARLQQENAELRHQAGAADTQALLEENEQLRVQLQRLQDNLGSSLGEDQFADLRAEIELLRGELDNKDKELTVLAQGSGGDETLRAENDMLKKLLEERELAAAESPLVPKTENDLERYEAELNEFRRTLEIDRVKLNKEVEMLRDRNKELDEAIREMEMEMSKERAELGRERMKLERVREEVKSDSERLQREMQVRDSLAPVQKLRDEMTQKQPGKSEKPLNDRLRGVRNQLADGQPSGS